MTVCRRLRAIGRGLEMLTFALAVTCLGWAYVTWKSATFYQLHAKREMTQYALAHEPASADTVPAAMAVEPNDDVIGLLNIPRADISAAVIEGDRPAALAVAVAHVAGTPRPWEPGNSVLAAHRDSFFRSLGALQAGDAVMLTTRHGLFTYRVREVMIVGPEDVWVLAAAEGINLTLITCYPFTYVGPAPERFVVRAERIGDAAAGAAIPDGRAPALQREGSGIND